MSFFGKRETIRPPFLPDFTKGAKVTATFDTSLGLFVAKLFADEVPMTVGNFVGLATGEMPWKDKSGKDMKGTSLYAGTVFHRVIPEFMIQGGDPEGSGRGGPGYRFSDEFDKKLRHNKPGILSMANAGPDSNGSQFFVTEVPTGYLDDRHSVFGEVVSGFEVVKKIGHTDRDHSDRPLTPVVLKSVTINIA